ncbi:hypothetical protein [Pseudomonas aeruginosa]|uniref:hypothetical protein n=1 Tax=Pseudomonas aeruginosa group TaxID=136841 RepID=UPI00223856A0|nr:hypothetical protein [Pseudomonas aeruginosa]MCW5460042.1 hypothetical protein [Pseudomonas aeruginosa]MCW5496728.1 hypothetical protein [Pseudomonas aeruginosa]
MLTIFMASASLACWVCTERTAQRGFGFNPAKGLAKLIDNVPHLLAFVASAGLAAQSPILGVVLLAMHNVVLLLLALMVRADTLDARSPRLRKRSDALATMDEAYLHVHHDPHDCSWSARVLAAAAPAELSRRWPTKHRPPTWLVTHTVQLHHGTSIEGVTS